MRSLQRKILKANLPEKLIETNLLKNEKLSNKKLVEAYSLETIMEIYWL